MCYTKKCPCLAGFVKRLTMKKLLNSFSLLHTYCNDVCHYIGAFIFLLKLICIFVSQFVKNYIEQVVIKLRNVIILRL